MTAEKSIVPIALLLGLLCGACTTLNRTPLTPDSGGGADGGFGVGGSGAVGVTGSGGRSADAATDASSGGDVSHDTSVVDAGDARSDACAPTGVGAVAILGCSCSSAGTLACNENAQPVVLICSQGTWTVTPQQCQSGNLCDSRVGLTQGTCQPIDPLCRTATPGQAVCSGPTSVVRCGPDLVSESAAQPCTGATPACLNGVCVACRPTSTQSCGACSDGTQVCSSAGAWGACTGASSMHTYYRDADGDGFGNPKAAMTICGAMPVGYVGNSSDCCDADGNAHPGQTAFFAVPDTCGNDQVPDGYDYNCDGVDTLQNANLGASCVTVEMASPDCGCPLCECNSINGTAPVCGLTSCTEYSALNPPCGTTYTISGHGFSAGTCSPGAGGSQATQGCQ